MALEREGSWPLVACGRFAHEAGVPKRLLPATRPGLDPRDRGPPPEYPLNRRMRNRTYGGVRGLRGLPLTLLDSVAQDLRAVLDCTQLPLSRLEVLTDHIPHEWVRAAATLTHKTTIRRRHLSLGMVLWLVVGTGHEPENGGEIVNRLAISPALVRVCRWI